MLFTGYSLGRDKLEQLMRQWRLTKDKINTIISSFETKEVSLDAFEVVNTSTQQAIDK